RKILAHPINHELSPANFILERLQGFLNACQECGTRISSEFKSCSFFGGWVPRLDGVVEAAGGSYDWHCPIFQTVNLVQAARLVARGHQEHICASLDLVRDGVIVGHLDRKLLRKLVLEAVKHLFIFSLSP